MVNWQTTGLVTMVQWNLHNHCNTTPHSLLFTWMVYPQKHVPLVSFQSSFFMHCVCSGNNITDDGKRMLESKCNKDTLAVLSVWWMALPLCWKHCFVFFIHCPLFCLTHTRCGWHVPLWLLSRPVCGVCVDGMHVPSHRPHTHSHNHCGFAHRHTTTLWCVCVDVNTCHMTMQCTTMLVCPTLDASVHSTITAFHVCRCVLPNGACPSSPCHHCPFPPCGTVLHPHAPHAHHPCVSVVLSSNLAFTSVGLLGTATLNPCAHHSHPSHWLCITLCLCFSSSNHQSRTIFGWWNALMKPLGVSLVTHRKQHLLRRQVGWCAMLCKCCVVWKGKWGVEWKGKEWCAIIGGHQEGSRWKAQSTKQCFQRKGNAIHQTESTVSVSS